MSEAPNRCTARQDAAALAHERLRSLGDAEGKRIYDPTLNDALNPLRSLPAIEVVCGSPRCGLRVGWWAIDSGHAYIAATEARAKPKQRLGGMSDLASPAVHSGRFLPWIALAETGRTSVRLVDFRNPSGFPLRLKFVCRRGHDHTTTNTYRLQLFLAAIAAGKDKIYL